MLTLQKLHSDVPYDHLLIWTESAALETLFFNVALIPFKASWVGRKSFGLSKKSIEQHGFSQDFLNLGMMRASIIFAQA